MQAELIESGILTAYAPAKINLALHVTGRRDDGYHLIDTLAVFTGFGDRITIVPDAVDRLDISGPFANALGGSDDNIVSRARDLVRDIYAIGPVAIHLEKNLPVASGIGGGSSDAAAVMKALNAAFSLGMTPDQLAQFSLPLGADLPMCVHARPLLARGIGEQIQPVDDFPELPMVLVNPGVHVATPAVFKALSRRDHAALPDMANFRNASDVADWLNTATRNDLQAAAISLCPEISDALIALEEQSPLLARMSGSGATCFALFKTTDDARQASEGIARANPAWFVAATLSSSSARASHDPH